MTVPLGKRIRRSLRSALVRAIVRLFAFLPLRPVLALATVVGRVGRRVAARTRRQVLAQLEIAFPEKAPGEREAIGRASLVHLAWLAAEVATLRRWRARLADYVRSAVIARAGNDPAVTALVGRIRAEGNLETLWREDPSTARAMIRTFKQGRPLGILIDQDTRVQSVFVPFFGRPAATPRGAADLALRFGAPVLAGWCRRRGPRPGDGHEIDFVEVSYDRDLEDRDAEATRLTAACTAHLEAAIRSSPAEWVWMHERWKTPPEPAVHARQARAVPKSAELSSG